MARVSRVKRNIVGVNWHLRYRLKIEDLEHKLDDMRLYVRQLERKLKKTYFFFFGKPINIL